MQCRSQILISLFDCKDAKKKNNSYLQFLQRNQNEINSYVLGFLKNTVLIIMMTYWWLRVFKFFLKYREIFSEKMNILLVNPIRNHLIDKSKKKRKKKRAREKKLQ